MNVNGATTETTIYVAGLLEKVTIGATTDYKHYVDTPTGSAAIHIRSSTGSNTTSYLLRDHLGSVDKVTNSAGAILNSLSYDAFGKRRGSGWTGAGTPPSATRHGFTDHEHLDNLTLIHMNGRVDDPVLGRFTSADPFVTEASNTQGFNRYSYVLNNPLTLVDTNGFEPEAPPPSGPCFFCAPDERPRFPPVRPTPPPRPGAPIDSIPVDCDDSMSAGPVAAAQVVKDPRVLVLGGVAVSVAVGAAIATRSPWSRLERPSGGSKPIRVTRPRDTTTPTTVPTVQGDTKEAAPPRDCRQIRQQCIDGCLKYLPSPSGDLQSSEFHKCVADCLWENGC